MFKRKTKIEANFKTRIQIRGVARTFQSGVTLCQSEGARQIVMSFLAPVVGCLLKKGLQMRGSRVPQEPPPSYTPVC